jgi:type IV secretory pathway TrbD component
LQRVLDLSDWQPWKVPTAEGFWTGVHWAYRIPIFIAYLAFTLTTLFWPAPKNLAHLMALSAAVLIGIQFWFADKGGLFVLWYLPLLLLLVFRPNLSDRFPPAIQPETDWLYRVGRGALRSAKRAIRLPEPVGQVQ